VALSLAEPPRCSGASWLVVPVAHFVAVRLLADPRLYRACYETSLGYSLLFLLRHEPG